MTSRQLLKQLFQFVANYPKWLIGGVGLISILALTQLPNLRLDPSIKSMVPQEHPIVKTMDKIDELFGSSAIVIVAVESDSLFSPSVLKMVAALHDSLAALPVVGRVTSIMNVSTITSDAFGFVVAPLIRDINGDLDQIDLKRLIRANDQIYGNLVSKDFRMLSLICPMVTSFDYDEHVVRQDVERVVSRFAGRLTIFYAGIPITRADVTDQMGRDLRTFMPYGMLLMIIFLTLSFRSWLGVVMPLTVVVISTLWTFGLMGFLKMTVPFTGILIPVMLIAIANDYGIHIIAHYYEYTKMDPGADRRSVIKKTVQSLGIPIFLAGLTTVIGFLGLLGHALPRAREIGLLMSFGIGIAFILSMTLIPALLVLSRRPKYLSRKESMTGINTVMRSAGLFFYKHRRSTMVIFILVIVVVGMGINNLKVDSNPDNYYKPNAPIRVNNEAISRIFGGTTQISILVEGDIESPQVLRDIEKLQRYVERDSLVTRTASVVDVLKKMNRAFHGDDPAWETIPESRALVAQYLFIYSMTGDESDFDLILDDTDAPQHTQIMIRLEKNQALLIADLVENIETFIDRNISSETSMDVAGPATLLGVMARLIIRGQVISLAISVLLIFLIMAFTFRSWVGGLLSIIPLIGSILFIFGFMGITGIELNIATVMTTSVLVGVGIDYTVHFLWHLKQNLKQGLSLEDGIAMTLQVSGKGILYNALSVMIGFSVLLFSVFLPVNFFGILIVISMSVCLLGALVLLPAVIGYFKPKFLMKYCYHD